MVPPETCICNLHRCCHCQVAFVDKIYPFHTPPVFSFGVDSAGRLVEMEGMKEVAKSVAVVLTLLFVFASAGYVLAVLIYR